MGKKAERKALESMLNADPMDGVDCACVIHGDYYSWDYVEKLHAGLKRAFSYPIRLHVFTEEKRSVPGHMVKHVLEPWSGIAGPRKAWWYKMQIFDPRHFSSRVLYLDLDVVLTGNLDWMLSLSPRYFWTLRDFRALWKPNWQGMNSSMMFWDPRAFPNIWKNFRNENLSRIMKRYAGDQDYLSAALSTNERRFIDDGIAASWRWQVREGGMDMKTRTYRRPGAGSVLPPDTRMVIFHGQPKPHEVHDELMLKFWTL